MKKRKIVFIVFLLAIIDATYWLFEPYSLNPFSEKPLSLSNNENNLNCISSKKFSDKGDKLLNSTIKSGRLLGVTTGIYSKRCGSWLSSAGYLTKSGEQVPNKSSLFRIASISKSMTAVAILQLLEKGIIDLDTPIQEYLPEFPKKAKGEITIRQILKHRGGIPHYKSKFGIFNFTHYANSIEALDKFKDRDLLYKPGTGFKYSSFGYVILGAIIEKVTGQSYQDYMEKNIWKPANMTSTSIEKSDNTYDNKAGLYIKLGNTFIRVPKNDLSYMQSGGGIQSTAHDLLKFGQAILDYKLITPSTTELMIMLSTDKKDEIEYTYGWDSKVSSKDGRIIEHNGTQIGASSYLRIYFDKKIVVATLSNSLSTSEPVKNLSLNLAETFMNNENM